MFACAQRGESDTILILGDSLSAAYGIDIDSGWVRLLEQKLASQQRFEVINASVSGETTSGGLARLPALLESYRPAIVVIELGGNDGLRGQSTQRMTSNLRELVLLSKEAGAKVLLLGMRIPPNYGSRYTQAFHEAFHKVARTEDTPLVPFFLEGVATEPRLMQNDGVHPKAEAQRAMLENVWPALEALLE